LHREQDGVLGGIIRMFMPGPRRDDKKSPVFQANRSPSMTV
jgi:hypothetical protein